MTRWIDNAKCVDMNPLDFDLSDRKVPYQHRQSTAAGLCSGCEVMQACARDALKYVDLVLTVRAGLWVEARQTKRNSGLLKCLFLALIAEN